MYSHIMVGANDIEESKKFYDSTFAVLGAEPGVLSVNPTGHKRYMYFLDGNVFLISEPIDDQVATHGNGSTCLLYTSPSPRDRQKSRMPSSA